MHANFDLDSTAAASVPMPARLLPGRFLAIWAVALCLSTNLFADTVQMAFDGVNGAEAFGVYVGPYYGTMNGAPIDLFCVDFSNEVQFGEQWDANLTPIAAGANLSDTRFGGEPDALQNYEEAAWLAMQYAVQPASQYGDIQATIWQLFSNSAPAPGSSSWLQQAQANYASADYGDFAIVTNTGPVQLSGQIQEFLTEVPPNVAPQFGPQTPTNAAPEPRTEAMIGLALAVAGSVCRRRTAQSRV